MSSIRYLRPPLPLYRVFAGLCVPVLLGLNYTGMVHRLGPLRRVYWHDYLRSTIALPKLFKKQEIPGPEYEVLLCAGSAANRVPVTVEKSVSRVLSSLFQGACGRSDRQS